MAITVQCDSCKATLNVNDSMAGKRGKCPHCKSIVAVPGSGLSQVTPDDVVAEFFRRGKSAVLVLFDTPADGNYALHEQGNFTVNCVGSDDMTSEQLNTVVRSIATLSKRHEQAATFNENEKSSKPY